MTGLKLHNLIAWQLADDFKLANIIVNQKLGDKTTMKNTTDLLVGLLCNLKMKCSQWFMLQYLSSFVYVENQSILFWIV